MRTRSCNVVRATLVACGTIGLLASLATAQQADKIDPAAMKKVSQDQLLKKDIVPKPGTTQKTTKADGSSQFGARFTGVRTGVAAGHQAAGGGIVLRGNVLVDSCTDAGIQTVGEGSSGFSIVGFTSDGGDVDDCSFENTIDGWVLYSATVTGTATITTCDIADYDSSISAFDACGGTQIACMDDGCASPGFRTNLSMPVTAGTTYVLRFSGFFDAVGGGMFDISVAPPPSGDEEVCGAANPVLVLDTPASADNTGATTDATVTSCTFGNNPSTGDLYWRFTAPADASYRFSTCGSSLDTVISVFSGCPVDEFSNMLGCNDDSCGGTLQSSTDVVMTTGQEVFVRVAGWNNAQGAFQVMVSLTPPPADCHDCPVDAVLENELDCGIVDIDFDGQPDDNVNGGCNNIVSPVFTSIAVGQTACGTGAFDGAFRDTDWYEFTLTEDTEVTWAATAEFPVLVGLIQAPCPATAFIAGTAFTAPACTLVTSTACLPAGNYYAFIAPDFIEAFACGTGPGNRYTATLSGVPCDAPDAPANDLCVDAEAFPAAPLPNTVFGTTIGSTPSGATCVGNAPDVFYSFTPDATDTFVIDTCGSSYDTSLAVFTDCDLVTQIACNDDFCGLQSTVTVALSQGLTYYIRVGGFAGQTGDFQLTISPPAECYDCPVDAVLENEPANCGIACGDDFNGGCNSTNNPGVATSIAVGNTVCGTSESFIDPCTLFETRDTDWYTFTLTEGTLVTWTATAEFPVLIGLINTPCPQTAFIDGTAFTAAACTPVSSSACLPAGTYYAFIAPSAFTGTPCGARYVASLTGEPCTPPEPPANDACENAIVVSAPSSTPGTTIAAAPSGTTTCGANSPDVFYELTAPVTGSYTIDTCTGSNFDTRLSIFTDCPTLTQIACNDDFCALQSSITIDLTAGTTYFIRVSAFGATASGDFTLTISGPPVASGGCCIAGECTIQTEAACLGNGGSYLGDNTDCGSGGGGFTSVTNPNLAIPDNDPLGVSSTLAAGGGTITELIVGFHITHTWQGDLTITLTHDATNTTVALVTRPGNPQTTFGFSADNYGAPGAPFFLSDAAATTYDAPQVAAPGINNVGGAWLADVGSLAAFDGLNATGNWTLTIVDGAGGDTGTLVEWGLIVNPVINDPCGPEFCDADWCQDGSVGVPDIFCFLSDWFSMDPDARCYGGTCDVPAIFAFLSVWFATGQGPCP